MHAQLQYYGTGGTGLSIAKINYYWNQSSSLIGEEDTVGMHTPTVSNLFLKAYWSVLHKCINRYTLKIFLLSIGFLNIMSRLTRFGEIQALYSYSN